MADFAPILLLGPVVTWRCHLFASWLLIATTLLCATALAPYRHKRALTPHTFAYGMHFSRP